MRPQGYVCKKCRRLVEIHGYAVYDLKATLAHQNQVCPGCLDVKEDPRPDIAEQLAELARGHGRGTP